MLHLVFVKFFDYLGEDSLILIFCKILSLIFCFPDCSQAKEIYFHKKCVVVDLFLLRSFFYMAYTIYYT